MKVRMIMKHSNIRSVLLCIYCLVVIFGLFSGKAEDILLGPANPGAEGGADRWYYGHAGTGTASIDATRPATGSNDFLLGNTLVDRLNRADWRCETFPLGSASSGAAPLSFSFKYELPGNVHPGNNIRIYLRFFDQTGSYFIEQSELLVGAATKDSGMSEYKTIMRTLYAPPNAQKADIWVTANVFGKWTSGIARFDDFSVKLVPHLISQTFIRDTISVILTVLFLIPLIALAKRSWSAASSRAKKLP